MKKLVLFFAAACVATYTNAADLRPVIAKEATAMRPKLVECRRDFHEHPELSNREERTSKVIAERLKALGIPIETGVAKYGVVARIDGRKPGKVVAVRADIDALPIEEVNDVPYRSQNKGVKHACGHDAHTTIGLATAELLWKHRNDFDGTAYVIFQPAEEGPPVGEEGGAELMVKEGLLDRIKPAAIFALHSMPTTNVGDLSWTPGSEMASSDRFHITVRGKGTHGAAPHLGVDPIVAASQLVMALQTIDSRRVDPIEPVVVTIGAFHAGNRFNIIPDTAELDGTLRTLSPAVREQAKKLIESIATSTAVANGATAEVKFDLGIPVLQNDPTLSSWGEASLQKTVGAAHVHRDPPRMIAEDHAFFAERVPSFYYYLGVRNEARGITAALHTPAFDLDEDALVVGTEAMTNLVLDYLTSPPKN